MYHSFTLQLCCFSLSTETFCLTITQSETGCCCSSNIHSFTVAAALAAKLAHYIAAELAVKVDANVVGDSFLVSPPEPGALL